MNRYNILVSTLLALLLTVAGCSGDTESGDTTASEPDEGSTATAADSAASSDGDLRTVTVWDRDGAESQQRAVFLEQWNEEVGPGLGVFIDYQPQGADSYVETVRLAFQTQRAPDVFHSVSAVLPALIETGFVQSLDGLVDQQLIDAVADFTPERSELRGAADGELYAIPTLAFTSRLYYNRELFEQAGLDPDNPPATFSEVREAAAAITELGDETYGIAVPTAWPGFYAWDTQNMVQGLEEDMLSSSLFNYQTGQFEQERFAPVVQLYRDVIADGSAFPGSETLSLDTALAPFAEGNIGMFVIGSMAVPALNSLGVAPDVIDVAPIPVPDGEELVATPLNAGFAFSIAATTEDPEAAAIALEAISGAEIQTALAAEGIPPLLDEAWDTVSEDEQPLLAAVRPDEQDKQWPRTPEAVLTVEGETTQDFISQIIIQPDTDLESALAEHGAMLQQTLEAAVEDGSVDPAQYGL